MPERRLPPPWSVDDPDMKLGQDCYIVRDPDGHALVYLLTRDEALRIAANIARLPEVLREP